MKRQLTNNTCRKTYLQQYMHATNNMHAIFQINKKYALNFDTLLLQIYNRQLQTI